MVKRRWYFVRLWVISLALFACGFIGRLVLDWQGETAYSYPIAVELQMYWYTAGLFVLLLWIIGQAGSVRVGIISCVAWFVLAFALALAILSSIPK